MTMITEQDKPLTQRKTPVALNDIRPVCIVDTREQMPLPISRFETVRGVLQSGDYSFMGAQERFAVERKSIPDLVACCVGESRNRFLRELHRLKGFDFARLLIVGERKDIEGGEYRSRVAPRAVLSTLAMIEARYIPVEFAPDPVSAARLVEKWIYWYGRELVRACEAIAYRRGNGGTDDE